MNSIGLKVGEAYSRKRIEVIYELKSFSREMVVPEITDGIGIKVGEAYSKESHKYLLVEIEYISNGIVFDRY